VSLPPKSVSLPSVAQTSNYLMSPLRRSDVKSHALLSDRRSCVSNRCLRGASERGGGLRGLVPSGSAEPTSEKLAHPIRESPTDLAPSRWTLFGFLPHLVLGPRPRATPALDRLLQSGQPAELEPESEATADWRSIGREVLHPSIDQVLSRLELPLPADIDRPETNRRRREPGHRSGAVGQKAIPVSPQMHARPLAAFLPRAPLQLARRCGGHPSGVLGRLLPG